MRVLPLVALVVLSLLQSASAVPRPEFALTVNVPGRARVSVAATDADAAITAITGSVDSYVISSELELLTSVAEIIADIATQFQTLAAALVLAVTNLATDTSGDVATTFTTALDAVQAAISFTDDTLPGLKDPLVPLVGTDLPHKFLDSFQHIGKALQALHVSLTAMQTGALAAVSEAGSANVPARILNRHLPRTMVSELIDALYLLKATVPLLEFVVSETMEYIGLADAFLLELDAKVDSVIGDSSTLQDELGDVLDPFGDMITTTLGTIDDDLGTLATEFGGLSNLATASSAGDLGTVLASFQTNLDDLASADPTIAAVLDSLGNAITDTFDIVDPLYFIYDSALVDALITTLVANGDYSEYCFYKYKDYFFELLDLILLQASQCIAEESVLLEYYRDTVSLMFELLSYDIADISDDLSTCERIDDPDNLEECTSKFVQIYTDLEGSFGDKLTFVYESLQHEIAASGNRLAICIRLSQSELSDTEVPLLLRSINACAADGPYAADD